MQMTVGELKELLSAYSDDRILSFNWLSEQSNIRDAVIAESAFEYNGCEYLSLCIIKNK